MTLIVEPTNTEQYSHLTGKKILNDHWSEYLWRGGVGTIHFDSRSSVFMA